MSQDYKLDPRFARDVIRAPKRKELSREPPKVSEKYAREYIYNSGNSEGRLDKKLTHSIKSEPIDSDVNTHPKFDNTPSKRDIKAKKKSINTNSIGHSYNENIFNTTNSGLYSIENKISRMDGHQFEEYIIRLFQDQGLTVKGTMASNDGGLDGVVFFEGKKFGLQVKNINPRLAERGSALF